MRTLEGSGAQTRLAGPSQLEREDLHVTHALKQTPPFILLPLAPRSHLARQVSPLRSKRFKKELKLVL